MALLLKAPQTSGREVSTQLQPCQLTASDAAYSRLVQDVACLQLTRRDDAMTPLESLVTHIRLHTTRFPRVPSALPSRLHDRISGLTTYSLVIWR